MFRRLTEEEASHHYTAKEDNLNLNGYNSDWDHILGYTLEPDPRHPKWNIITYYSKRKRIIYREGEGNYYIYVLSNPSMPNIYKIGYTGKHPEIRAKQISAATGVPTPYKVEYAFRCNDGELAEREVHKALSYCRVSTNKEHFALPLDEAKEIVEQIGSRYTYNDIQDSK